MRKRILVSVASAAAIAGVAGVITTSNGRAYAATGDQPQFGTGITSDWRDAMEQAFSDNDYDTWRDLVEASPGKGRKQILEVITSENFPRFAEAHRLALKGDVKGANSIRQELGLPLLSDNKTGGKHKGNGYSWQLRQLQPAT